MSSGTKTLRQAAPAAMVLTLLIVIAIGAPLLAPYDPSAQLDIQTLSNLPPSLAHPFGTDSFSRDILSRVMYGARISLGVAGIATAFAITAGTFYGALAGYLGGAVDAWMMRAVDALLAVPRVLLVIVVVALWPSQSMWLLIFVLGTTGWFTLSRRVRGQVLALRSQDFIIAAHALGTPRARIVLRHVLPNVVPTIIVAATLGIGQVIVLEAGLSYLGLGIQPPEPSWGNIIQDGVGQFGSLWWISVFPGLCIVTTAVAFNALGDIIQDALDPRDVRLGVYTGAARPRQGAISAQKVEEVL